ncbi:MAG: methylated-DNA--[protein]-cysteine S-methyltransferase [Ignavibacteriaceae bacterium]|nr:methylated-DNA--[protein]-cysteine S-methyltransferase [Ignavibacteriaceae bacterium]
MKDTEQLFYSTLTINGINFKVFASHKGILKIFINDKGSKIKRGEAIKLHPDDPYMFNIFKQLKEYFNRERDKFDVPLDLRGTDFQKGVWKELRKIPYGRTITYKELAVKMGSEKKTRAVGQANALNPIPIVVPCHRVINTGGNLGGYSGGLEVKEKLLELEGKLSLELFEDE